MRDLIGKFRFGAFVSKVDPWLPFQHLCSDGVWEIPQAKNFDLNKKKASAELKEVAQGGFPEELHGKLCSDNAFLDESVETVLRENFPLSLHQEILDESGFEVYRGYAQKRDPGFREEVLRNYLRQCAICGFGASIGAYRIAIEAAHIRWHAKEGPNNPENGIALCTFHHKLFDRGVFTITEDLNILVSADLNGPGSDEIIRLHRHKIAVKPQRSDYSPKKEFIQWHFDEVFRRPSRE